jgi:two-component sensor histidine kinase/PAS domain-containing protein
MDKSIEETKAFKLRKRAEKKFSYQYHDVKDSPMDFEDIISELRIHQFELEIQNQELIESQAKLEHSRHKYFELYNFAPVGYFTLNNKGLIIDANLVGASLLKIEIKDLYKTAFIRFIHPDSQNRFYHLHKNSMQLGNKQVDEIKMIKNDGNTFYAHIEAVNSYSELNNGPNIAIIDISDRKGVEKELKKSLEDKEVLIREIHHRVKNNLQIIASLLHLQESTLTDKNLITILKESEVRVKSMATIHEKLYQSRTFQEVNFKEYLEQLIIDILYTYKVPKDTIQVIMNIEDINLNIETSIPLGLIINELVTNCVKYAFPKMDGTITIELKTMNDEIELNINDNGIGLPLDIDLENSETLGLQLVNNLTSQIDGHVDIDRSHGTNFKITFKEIKYKIRK